MTEPPPAAAAEGTREGRARALVLALLAVGATLRLWQYSAGASLWLDELALARNVVDRPLGPLLARPLDFGQVAPRGFLAVERLAVDAFGDSEYALRLFPLLCALAALPLFALVARRVLRGSVVPLAVALFALAVPLVAYGAQAKQYSGDVAAAVAVAWLALAWRADDGVRRRTLFGAAGLALVWFSQAAVLALAGAGAALAAAALLERDARARRSHLRALVPTLAPWALGAAAATAVSVLGVTPTTRAYMRDHWWGGFVPVPRSLDDALWAWRTALSLFGDLLSYPLAALYVAAAALGVWSLWRRRRTAALVLLGPIAVTLAAAAARQYPFADRLVLFLVPTLLILVAEGADVALSRRPPNVPAAAGGVLAVALALPAAAALVMNPPVYRPEEIRPVLEYVRAHRAPGEPTYVYYGAWQAVSYYGARYGLRDATVVVGGCHRGDPRAYLRELDRLRGARRAWVVVAHALGPLHEDSAIVGYLDAIGVRRGGAVGRPRPDEPPDVFALAYDLSDPSRLAAASAETAPLAAPAVTPSIGDGCEVGPQVPPAAAPDGPLSAVSR